MFRPQHLYTIFLLACLFINQQTFGQHKPWRENEMEVFVKFSEAHQAEILGKLNLKGDIYNTHACMYLTPAELEMVKNTGLDYTVHIADLNAWSASFGAAMVPPGYYTFEQIKDIADSLAANFPAICKKVIFGYTPQFKELAALKISDNVNVDENEAEIMFDGGIHGNEVGGSQNMIKFARDLCLAYGNNTYITNLINTREIWLYYCVNPYGRDYMTRENSSGVDINRDFGYAWDDGSSSAPFSQPESKALRDCQYSNQFVSYTNYHSGAETISYPWSYRFSPAPDNAHIATLASIYSINSGYSNLPYGQGSLIMYLINGSTKDFNYGCMGSVAWSIEISLDKQPLGSYIQYYYNINKPAMLALIEHAGYGIAGTVTDAVTGLPVKASVWIGNNYPTFTDGDAGDYHKYMVPGIYTLRFCANGYQPLIINDVTVNALQSTVTNVQLQPAQSQFGYRTCVSRIPNFNAQNPGDEGYTAACLGAPDNVNYSLGKGGYIMMDMQTPVVDEAGPDITVYEGDASPEGYSVYALTDMDAPWKLMGTGTGTSNFDLLTAGVPEAQFFVIQDDDNGTANVNDAGFDFDAIKNIHGPIPDTLAHLSGKVYDALSGLHLEGVFVAIGDSLFITDTAGFYSGDVMRGSSVACASHAFYNTRCDTLQLVAGEVVTHDFYLNNNVGLPQTKPVFSVSTSPNPFNDKLDISFFNEKEGRVKIFLTPVDGTERILLVDSYFGSGMHSLIVHPDEIARHSLASGVYILSIESDYSKQRLKVVKISGRL